MTERVCRLAAYIATAVLLFAGLTIAAAMAQPRITSRAGDVITLSVGSHDGVRAGMTGSVIHVVVAGGTSQRLTIARFSVQRVDDSSCAARLIQVGDGFETSVVPGLDVEFDARLERPASPAPAPVATAAPRTQSESTSLRTLTERARSEDLEAQYELARAYWFGQGAPKDPHEAAYWYRKAAERGHADAQSDLGFMYAEGLGVAKDDAEALRWYRRAAEQGHAIAQYNLGIMCLMGRGVAKDSGEAIRWFRAAAEQGHAEAQFNMGIGSARGEGVMQSGAAAAHWFYQAGMSFLEGGDRERALICVERIRDLSSLSLNVPNAFLADKLLNAIYGKSP